MADMKQEYHHESQKKTKEMGALTIPNFARIAPKRTRQDGDIFWTTCVHAPRRGVRRMATKIAHRRVMSAIYAPANAAYRDLMNSLAEGHREAVDGARSAGTV